MRGDDVAATGFDTDLVQTLFFIVRPVDLVAMPEGPHPIPFRTRSLSPPGPMVLRLKARESRSPPGLQDGRTSQMTLPFRTFPGFCRGVEQSGSSSGS